MNKINKDKRIIEIIGLNVIQTKEKGYDDELIFK